MSFAHKISAFNRKRKWDLFKKEIAPNKNMSVLDVGFSEDEYSSTDNYIEKNYPYPENLTALGIDVANNFKAKYPKVTPVHYDGNAFPFENKSFDICWSNAVIEHVGDRDKQLFFLKEIKRVAQKAFITTPNRYFPVEVHTQTPLLHYFPKVVFDKYLSLVGKGWAAGDYMYLLSIYEMELLLRDSGISNYRIFKNKLLGFTLDFVVIFET
jgi:Methyltransferase domain